MRPEEFSYKTPKYRSDPLFKYFKNSLQDSLPEDFKDFAADCAVSVCKLYKSANKEEISSQLSTLKGIFPLSHYPDQDKITESTLGLCDKNDTQSIYYFFNIDKIKDGNPYEVFSHELVHYMAKEMGDVSNSKTINEGGVQIISAKILDDLGIERMTTATTTIFSLDKSVSQYVHFSVYGNSYRRESYAADIVLDIEGEQNFADAVFNGKKIKIDSQVRDIDIFLNSLKTDAIEDTELIKLRMSYMPLYMEKYSKEHPGADYMEEYIRKTAEIIKRSPTVELDNGLESVMLIKGEASVPSDSIAITQSLHLPTQYAAPAISHNSQQTEHIYASTVMDMVRAFDIKDFDIKTARFKVQTVSSNLYAISLSNKSETYNAQIAKRFIRGEEFTFLSKIDNLDLSGYSSHALNPSPVNSTFKASPDYSLTKSRYYLTLAEKANNPYKICQYALTSGIHIEDISDIYPIVKRKIGDIKTLDDLPDSVVEELIKSEKIEFIVRNNNLNYDNPMDLSRKLPNGQTVLKNMLDSPNNDYAMELLFQRIKSFARLPEKEQTQTEWLKTMMDCDINQLWTKYHCGLLDMTVEQFVHVSNTEAEKEEYRKIFKTLLEHGLIVGKYEMNAGNSDERLSYHGDMTMVAIAMECGYSKDRIFNGYCLENVQGCKDLLISLNALNVIQNENGSCEYGYLKDGKEFIFGTDPRILQMAKMLGIEKIDAWPSASNEEILKMEIIQDLNSQIPPCHARIVMSLGEEGKETYRVAYLVKDEQGNDKVEDFGVVPKLFAEMYNEDVVPMRGRTHPTSQGEVLAALKEKEIVGKIYKEVEKDKDEKESGKLISEKDIE